MATQRGDKEAAKALYSLAIDANPNDGVPSQTHQGSASRQGYLAHKKLRPPRTLPCDNA